MSKIRIQGNASGTGTLTIASPNTSTDSTFTLPDGDVTLGLGISDSATATAMTITSTGDVGIGVTPKAWHSSLTALQVGGRGALHATASQQTNLSTNVYANASNIWTAIATDGATMYQQDAIGQHVFFVAGSTTADTAITWTTAMTIANDGRTHFSTPNGACAIMDRTGSTGTLQSFLSDGSGVGSIAVTSSSTSYNTSSDYRLKENVTPMSGSIDRLKLVKASRFNFIADPSKTVDGFLAHEIAEVVPEVTSGEKDAMKTEEYEVTPGVMGEREVPDYQGIDQAKLVPLLTGALQEAITKIETLEASHVAMEVRLTALEGL